jgi:glycosyltransferase involved in cell wall biosynthesis
MTGPAPGGGVSVVIPTRDRPHLLRQALASVRAQTCPPDEVWVIDDGSAPAVPAPSEGDARPAVRLLRLDRPVGAGGARNEAIRRSRGELIAFLDDDDRWRPRFLERVAGLLTAAPPGVAAAASAFDLWEDGRIVARDRPDPGVDLRRRLLEHPCVAPSAAVVRRAALEAVGGFDATLPRVEDWDLWLRLADRYAFRFLDEVLVDRTVQRPPPAVLLRAHDLIRARVAPRLQALPPRERRRIEAVHLLNRGVLLGRSGRRAEARRALWQAWRAWPRDARPVLQIGRTLLGERAWEAGRRLAAPLRAPR